MYSPKISINLPQADCIRRLYILQICLMWVIKSELLNSRKLVLSASHFSLNWDWQSDVKIQKTQEASIAINSALSQFWQNHLPMCLAVHVGGRPSAGWQGPPATPAPAHPEWRVQGPFSTLSFPAWESYCCYKVSEVTQSWAERSQSAA